MLLNDANYFKTASDLLIRATCDNEMFVGNKMIGWLLTEGFRKRFFAHLNCPLGCLSKDRWQDSLVKPINTAKANTRQELKQIISSTLQGNWHV